MSEDLNDSKFLDVVTVAVANGTPIVCYIKNSTIFSTVTNLEDATDVIAILFASLLRQGLKKHIWDYPPCKRVVEVSISTAGMLEMVTDKLANLIANTEGDIRKISTPME